jgi:hypothetical protein
VIHFDRPFEFAAAWNKDKLIPDVLELKDDHLGAAIRFHSQKGEQDRFD